MVEMTAVSRLKGFFVPFDVKEFIWSYAACPNEPEKIDRLWRLASPSVFWRESEIKSNKNGVVETLDGFVIQSRYVGKGLAECERLAVMAVTVGAGLPEEAQRLISSGSLYDATIADMLGSFAAEAAADSFCDYIKKTLSSKSLYTTLRFSPGYGDWSVAAQSDVMDFLEGCDGEIRLTDGGLLEPVKTITAAVGFSKKIQSEDYPLGFCSGNKKCADCTTRECQKK